MTNEHPSASSTKPKLNFRFLLSGAWIGGFVFCIIFAIATVFLGNWQMDRRMDKLDEITLSSITMTSSQYRTLKLRIYSLALKNNRSGLPLWSGVNTLKRTLWWHVTGLERVAQDLRSLYRSRLTRATVY